jgi:hypothetical protein
VVNGSWETGSPQDTTRLICPTSHDLLPSHVDYVRNGLNVGWVTTLFAQSLHDIQNALEERPASCEASVSSQRRPS